MVNLFFNILFFTKLTDCLLMVNSGTSNIGFSSFQSDIEKWGKAQMDVPEMLTELEWPGTPIALAPCYWSNEWFPINVSCSQLTTNYMLHKEARTGRLLIKVRVSRTFINKLFRRAKRGE